LKITNRRKTGGNAKFDERNIPIYMSDHNPNDRIYMRPNKPANEMTEEEIHAFAEEMYNRIMGILPEREESDEK
jgi:hypothetical protein